jgi:hypothetical protein
MDEEELVIRTRKSLKDKKSRSEILRVFQKRGYKLEYAEQILSKANRPKKIIFFSLYTLILIVCLAITSFSVLTLLSHKTSLENPFSGPSLTGKVISDVPATPPLKSEEIEITPEFISYLLNEVGAWKLHRNPITFESPIVNFKIGSQTFNSEISNPIKTERGLSDKADLQFDTSKEEVLAALTSENPKEVFRSSLASGKTTFQSLAGEAELFSKGYTSLYNSLK